MCVNVKCFGEIVEGRLGIQAIGFSMRDFGQWWSNQRMHRFVLGGKILWSLVKWKV